MAFDPDIELIISAYETKDDIGKILRCHLVIEQQLELLISTSSRAKVDGRTTFYSKINLLRAIKVPEKICISCEALNDLRNKFAHNSKATIANTKASSSKFLSAVEDLIPILPQSHGSLHRRKEKIEHVIDYQGGDQGQRIVIAASFLSAVIGTLPKLYDFGEPSVIASMSGLNLP
ncbi:hypothetical protein [Devosia neptuniae]|uniref:hypothetical protein n=2 Tax=Devosia TaxID=46913 RepID=UPI0022AFD481|nr:hypothetical protein [Devosia neptuniae]MCZ4344752.1 hypothetical protein [Devosia neptuniae]|tara:strand:- start:981 stop:1508 length:528 start_codon:yes stop_codon:yes gene_type:complete